MTRRLASRPSDLKLVNKSQVLRYVYENGVTSKTDICNNLGMSKPTASGLIDELVSERALVQIGVGSSTSQGGKRPLLYDFNPNLGLMIALHIDVEKVSCALIDFGIRIHARIEHTNPKGSIQRSLSIVASTIRVMVDKAEEVGLPLRGIGVSVPGVVESEKGILVSAVHLEEWSEVPIGPYLEREFKQPVWVDNESRNMAMAERWFGVGKQIRSFITVQTKNGLGTGIILDGALYRGVDYSAGEFGHTTIKFDGLECRCGNRGCWELYATESALLNSISSAISHSVTDELQLSEPLDFELVARYYRENHPIVCEQIDLYAHRLGIGIVNLVNVFNPEMVILHGDLKVLGSPFLDKLTSIVQRTALKPIGARVRIGYSDLSGDTAIIGAASLVIREVIEGRTLWKNGPYTIGVHQG